jgi:hypothetical protein
MTDKQLPRHPPEAVWQWGVCAAYRDPERLAQVVQGKASLDPYDVLDLEIRAVDRVWVLLREAFLPQVVLARVLARIKSTADEFEKDHRTETLREVARREQGRDYWRVASRIASAAVKHRDPERVNVDAVYDEEYQRQLAIIREELDSWTSEEGDTRRA